jgi:hypothetical protein
MIEFRFACLIPFSSCDRGSVLILVVSMSAQVVVGQIEPSLLDRIFTHSSKLSSEAIIFFVDHLCQVSEMEIANASDPRIFSLQKIVEITYYNMGRVRYVWSRMWKILSEHFAHAGAHPNLKISMYAIDSLRQLAAKFLDKEELYNYQFQKVFLKPFESIMAKTGSAEIREFIIQCFTRLIFNKVTNVKSGWSSVFTVCKAGARDTNETVVTACFDLMERLLNDHFTLILNPATGTDCLPALVDALVTVGSSPFTDLSLQAVEYLSKCAAWLSESREAREAARALMDAQGHAADVRTATGDADQAPAAVAAAAVPVANNRISEHSPDLNVWVCLLRGLAQLISDKRLEIRTRALQVLFKALRSYGTQFGPTVWQIIYRAVLFPIFEDVRRDESLTRPAPVSPVALVDGSLATLSSLPPLDLQRRRSSTPLVSNDGKPAPPPGPPPPQRKPLPPPGAPGSGALEMGAADVDQAWLRTSCHAALSSVIELFAVYYDTVAFMLPEVLNLVCSCLLQESDELARIGSKCLSLLVQALGWQFDDAAWSTVLSSLHTAVVDTLPVELSGPGARIALGLQALDANTPAAPVMGWTVPMRAVVTKCTVQHLLLDVATELFRGHAGRLSRAALDQLLQLLDTSITFARSFNADGELRRRLWLAGFRESQKSVPDLFYQEAHGLAVSVSILLRLYQLEHTPPTIVPPATSPASSSGSAVPWVVADQAQAVAASVEGRLLAMCASLWQEFADKDKTNRSGTLAPLGAADGAIAGGGGRIHDDELRCKEPVAAMLLTGIKDWSREQLARHAPTMFPLWMALVEVDSLLVRKALRDLLSARLPICLTAL